MVYPASSADVYAGAVAAGGAVISLERWGSPPRRYAFPKRNAIIAALSTCLFVTEAGMRSGTMSTADVAVELGRKVYGIPGSIFSPLSAGTNWLISEGARVICDSRPRLKRPYPWTMVVFASPMPRDVVRTLAGYSLPLSHRLRGQMTSLPVWARTSSPS